MSTDIQAKIERNIPLAPLTTIGLGGPARELVRCDTREEVQSALTYAGEHNMKTYVLSGGSNTVFADEGFDGLVIVLHLRGVEHATAEDSTVLVTAHAGEPWDPLVASCVEQGMAGIECLSGIPGSTGATPMQNVGAYGQSVADTIVQVGTIERTTLERVTFTNDECEFGYRTSRFKARDRDTYIITDVTFRLIPNGPPTLAFDQLIEKVEHEGALGRASRGAQALKIVRDSVLDLRRAKSMVLDPNDPHARSCGSFFLNPIVPEEKFAELTRIADAIPYYEAPEGIKVPAAWLIEQSGFEKGQRRGNIGISPNHTLALVNYGGTTKELLAFAEEIQNAVKKTFNIDLVPEPTIVR